MALGPTYQRYGGFATPDFRALNSGQQAVSDRFKEAIGGVQDLLKQTEDQYQQENTLNMQEYLKNSLRSAGLGAEPVDKTAIQQKFGNMINMEQLDQTITDTSNQMLTEARDEAELTAGKAFAETEDIVTAGNVFQQRLRELGMKETDAAKEGRTWRTDNQFRAEDVKLRNERAIDDFSNQVIDTVLSHNGTASSEEVINFMVERGLPGKLKADAVLKARGKIEQLSKLTPEQIAEVQHAEKITQLPIDALDRESEVLAQQAKATADSISYLPEAAYKSAAAMQSKPGGLRAAISEDANGQIFEWGKWEEGQVGDGVQAKIDAATQLGIPVDEAQAIGLQAYNDVRSQGMTGVAVDGKAFNQQFDRYMDLYKKKKEATSAHSQTLEQNLKRRAALMAEREVLLNELRQGENFSNLSGKAFDSMGRLNSSSFGETLAAASNRASGMSQGTLPKEYAGYIANAAKANNVPEALIQAVIAQESGGNTKAVSHKGAQGLMQLMPGTAKDVGVTDPNDPQQNINGGSAYLAQMLKRYNGDLDLALAAYNAGPGAVDKHGGIPPYPETQNYVKSVKAQFEKLQGTTATPTDNDDPGKVLAAALAERAKAAALLPKPDVQTPPPAAAAVPAPPQSQGTVIHGFGKFSMPSLFDSAPKEDQVKKNIATLKKALEKANLSKEQKKELEDKVATNEAFLKKIKG